MRRISTLLAIFALTLCIFSPLRALCQEKPATSNWEVYFSPKGGCTDSIIRELNNAKHTILVQAYSFTVSKTQAEDSKQARHRSNHDDLAFRAHQTVQT